MSRAEDTFIEEISKTSNPAPILDDLSVSQRGYIEACYMLFLNSGMLLEGFVKMMPVPV